MPNASTGRKSSRASLQEEILQRRIPKTAAAAGPSSGQLLIRSKTEAEAAGQSSGQLFFIIIPKIVAEAAGPSSGQPKCVAAAAGPSSGQFFI